MPESKILENFFEKQHAKQKERLHEIYLDICRHGHNIRVFDENAREYDEWFNRYPAVFESELAALKELLPAQGRGVEIGAGTGRFSHPLGIQVGVEPAPRMAAIARGRGMEIHETLAENLPFGDESFDFALLVTVLSFVKNPLDALKEVRRILKKGGLAIIAFIEREGRLGRAYRSSPSQFYRKAVFYSTREMMDLLDRAGFQWREARQTLFSDHHSMTRPDKPKPGFGEGDFIVLVAEPRK